jgi:hypothetical protein
MSPVQKFKFFPLNPFYRNLKFDFSKKNNKYLLMFETKRPLQTEDSPASPKSRQLSPQAAYHSNTLRSYSSVSRGAGIKGGISDRLTPIKRPALSKIN